jgi:hypothetical protein
LLLSVVVFVSSCNENVGVVVVGVVVVRNADANDSEVTDATAARNAFLA